ncbi:MAG: cytochrome b N-terminal domain-containing protein [Candidatus Rokubacteria bacterium]|nr:cytochrome b N-terminal domain-containing protein [Candidatus Rokubacteria bacterium]
MPVATDEMGGLDGPPKPPGRSHAPRETRDAARIPPGRSHAPRETRDAARIPASATYARYDYWRPRLARALTGPVHGVDRLFDRVYTSRYNPLYRTGTLASLCLLIALVTGVYLLLVYEIGRPYDSVVRMQEDPFLGRPIRALHRYASDVAVVAVVLHVARLVMQGKTWGPRALAWITGVLLAGAMFLSAMTGFVLVWDEFGQALAVVGAKMLRLVPLFPEPPDRAFAGDRPMTAQFFFMNLFLHVAIPLGMVGLLWLHTTRLARAAWFPERKLALGTLAGLVVLAVVWPAPLPRAADLLTIPGRIEADWFYGFWLPAAQASPLAGLAVGVLAVALLLVVPWLLRPAAQERPAPAAADPDKCEGCEQCFKDCPYDAIQMVTGQHPDRHPLLAQVQPDLCVSCGVCAASCASLAIGPAGRTALHQLAAARELVSGVEHAGAHTVLIACRSNGGVTDRLRRYFADDGAIAFFDVDCAGTLHPATAAYLASRFGGSVVIGCPPQNCVHREGATLADARLLMGQKPAVPGRLGPESIRVLHDSLGEWPRIVAAIDAVRASRPAATGAPGTRARVAFAAAFSAVLLVLVAVGSGAPQGAAADHALLRLGWRLAGQVKERCRDLGADELAKRPVHMRTPRECASEVLSYDLRAEVDGRVVAEKRVNSPGLRADRPLNVEEDVVVAPGEHAVKVTFTPAAADSGARVLAFDGTLRFERGRVVLITSANDRLIVR